MKKNVLIFILLFPYISYSQLITQTIRGKVIDKASNEVLVGAVVFLPQTSPMLGTATDVQGNFRLEKVPVGRHLLKVKFVGYEDFAIPELQVNAGKEVILTIELTESLKEMDAVTVLAETSKSQPLNEMIAISGRTFSVEETQRYAAAFNDPLRMVASYAGVVAASEANNQIIIRGNSPVGLLWRLEGIDIPNPNHFAGEGSSGGGISMLSAQVLANSDFMTSAFPAEYGNAISGAFDLKLRKGNNEKREVTAQMSVIGLDIAIESPLSKSKNASFLINYRYSTLGLANKVVTLRSGMITFQDLSFNLHIPTKKLGSFTVFGLGGISQQFVQAVADSARWKQNASLRNQRSYDYQMGVIGFTHTYNFRTHTYLKTMLALSDGGNQFIEKRFNNRYELLENRNNRYFENRITFSAMLNHKFNARSTWRSGFFLKNIGYDLLNRSRPAENQPLRDNLLEKNKAMLWQVYSQWKYRINEAITFQTGLHFLYFGLNQKYTLEPRASLRYEISPQHAITLGYGLHAQHHPIGTYFANVRASDRSINQANINLDFTKSHHFVLGYDWVMNENWRSKIETYHQSLFNVPINPNPTSTFSILNQLSGFLTDSLVNKGKGRNYGLEWTLERFFSNNYYFLFSASLYESKYTAADGKERNTRFNGKFAYSLTSGKEWLLNKNRQVHTLGINLRIVYTGGFRYTPINLEASRRLGREVGFADKVNEAQLPDYFRTDLRLSWKKDKQNYSRTFAIDIQNLTNRENVFRLYYDNSIKDINKEYQFPFLPYFLYRVDF
ncbi:MAG: carboxypeptidase-like regulatory domain-containing protein [Thermoflexibacter sp.]